MNYFQLSLNFLVLDLDPQRIVLLSLRIILLRRDLWYRFWSLLGLLLDYEVFVLGLSYLLSWNAVLFDLQDHHRNVFAIISFVFFIFIDIIYESSDIGRLADYKIFFDHPPGLSCVVFNPFDPLKKSLTFIFIGMICWSFIIELLIALLHNFIVI